MTAWYVVGALVLLSLSGQAWGQEVRAPAARHEFGLWAGGSPSSPVVIGTSRQRRVSLVSLRYSRLLADRPQFALRYTADAIPVASLTQPRLGSGDAGRRERIYGAGFAPIGLQLNLRNGRALQPFVSSSGGALFFSRAVPYRDAARFNFMFDLGAGVQFRQGRNRWFTVGWKYHHLSNAQRAHMNPGVDSNVLFTGVSFTK